MASAGWRSRAATVACVCSFLVITRMLVPDPGERADFQYLFVITIGYGHLIGAAVFARRRMALRVRSGISRGIVRAVAAVGVLDLFVLYAWASQVSVSFFLPLLAISIWHIAENDLALGRSSTAAFGMGPVPRSREHHVAAIALTSLLLAVGQKLLDPVSSGILISGPMGAEVASGILRLVAVVCGLWLGARTRGSLQVLGVVTAAASVAIPAHAGLLEILSFGDFFSAVTLYHLVQFIAHFVGRLRRVDDPSARRARIRRLAWVHLAAVLLCVLLVVLPGKELAAVRYAVFSPAIYLFWSVLHVAQTVVARGFEPRSAATRQPVAA